MVDRLARFAVRVAARRWPADLAETMRDEWLAELAFVGGARAKLAFAGSLLVSPAVDGPTWADRLAAVGRAAAVTLAVAVVANLARGSGALAPLLLVIAAAGLVVIGRRVRVSVPLLGAALFAFLFAGNPVPVMPFMGAADIAPAVVTWVIVTALAARAARPLAVALGGLTAVTLATVAGSAHAAVSLGVPAWTAPAWFPLALLPGGTVTFGPRFADGAAAFGTLQASGPAFHASDILLANAAVMAGPLFLCTAFVLAPALRRSSVVTNAALPRRDLRLPAGLVAALVALAVGPMLPASFDSGDAALRAMVDNSAAFGFGFVEHPVGLGAVALLAAVLVMRAVGSRATTG